MKITAFIPARGGSKGLPGKNIKLLNGVPLLAYAIRAAKNCRHIDEVVVSTDSQEIFDVAVTYGAQGWMRQDQSISDDGATTETVIYEWLDAHKGQSDLMALIQCTAPLVLSVDISNCLRYLVKNRRSACFSVAPDDAIQWNGTDFPNVTDNRLPRQKRLFGKFREAGSVYMFDCEAFKKYSSRFCDGATGSAIPANRCYEIDSLQDFRICEFILKNAEEFGVEVEDGDFK